MALSALNGEKEEGETPSRQTSPTSTTVHCCVCANTPSRQVGFFWRCLGCSNWEICRDCLFSFLENYPKEYHLVVAIYINNRPFSSPSDEPLFYLCEETSDSFCSACTSGDHSSSASCSLSSVPNDPFCIITEPSPSTLLPTSVVGGPLWLCNRCPGFALCNCCLLQQCRDSNEQWHEPSHILVRKSGSLRRTPHFTDCVRGFPSSSNYLCDICKVDIDPKTPRWHCISCPD